MRADIVADLLWVPILGLTAVGEVLVDEVVRLSKRNVDDTLLVLNWLLSSAGIAVDLALQVGFGHHDVDLWVREMVVVGMRIGL